MKGRRLKSEPTETPYAENGTYGVVGGRRLATASYPILCDATVLFLELLPYPPEALLGDFLKIQTFTIFIASIKLIFPFLI